MTIMIAVPRFSSSSFLMGGSPSGSLSAWRLRREESLEDRDGIDLAKQRDSSLPPFEPTRKILSDLTRTPLSNFEEMDG